MHRTALSWTVGFAVMSLGLVGPVLGQHDDALSQDYVGKAVTEPPGPLQIDPFFDKYTDSTMDIPWYSDLEKPEGVGEDVTAAEYWNERARGLGRKEVTCAEENILGYPGTKYFGENILVHEFSHSIHQALKEETHSSLAEEIESAYRDAVANGLWEDHYASTNPAEYWAEGTQFWFNSNYQYEHGDWTVLNSSDLMRYDPKLYSLLEKVYSSDHHIPMDVFYKHKARVE